MSSESVMPSNHLILCRPLLLPPSIFTSIRVFSNESVFHIRWPEYWSFSFSITPSNEYSGLISFRMDWLDLLAVQGTLQESAPTPQFKIINSSALIVISNIHKMCLEERKNKHDELWAALKKFRMWSVSLKHVELVFTDCRWKRSR